MDTSNKTTRTDALGRRTGPRRKYSAAEKRRIVEESGQPGASVAVVAQRYGINANQVFSWRRLHRQGLLADTPVAMPPLLPVEVCTPTLLPTEHSAAKAPVAERPQPNCIEIEFPGGPRLRIQGRVDRTTLSRVIDALSRR
jgi:transposase